MTQALELSNRARLAVGAEPLSLDGHPALTARLIETEWTVQLAH